MIFIIDIILLDDCIISRQHSTSAWNPCTIITTAALMTHLQPDQPPATIKQVCIVGDFINDPLV